MQGLIDGGDQIVGVGTYHGTYRGTEKELQARVAHVWKLQHGKIVAFEQFTDTLLVNQARKAQAANLDELMTAMD